MNLMHNAAMLRSKVTKKACKNSTSKDEKIKKQKKKAVDTASDHPRHPCAISHFFCNFLETLLQRIEYKGCPLMKT